MHIKQAKQYLEFLNLSGIQDIFISEQSEINLQSKNLENLAIVHSKCKRCALHKNRIKFVYGVGSSNAKLMVISEAPGHEENLSGKLFVGASGQLLTKMLNAIKIDRKDIYITNVVKCTPPRNRNPLPEEIFACSIYLQEQLDIIKPEIILILGKVAAESLLKLGLTLTNYRKKTYQYQGIKTYVTYHPAALLRNAGWKKFAWVDLQKLQKDYERII